MRARSHDFGASQRRAAVVKYVENNRISSIFQVCSKGREDVLNASLMR